MSQLRHRARLWARQGREVRRRLAERARVLAPDNSQLRREAVQEGLLAAWRMEAGLLLRVPDAIEEQYRAGDLAMQRYLYGELDDLVVSLDELVAAEEAQDDATEED
jgi:hypothetical protein